MSRGVVEDEAPHDLLLQVVFGGVGVDGSSLSSSRRGSGVEGWGVGGATEENVSVFEPVVDESDTAIGFNLGKLSSA